VLGLAQPVEAFRAARTLLRRHREEPFDLILSNGLYGWPLTLARPDVPLVQVYHCTMAAFANHVLTLRSERLAAGHVMALFDRFAGIGKHVVVLSNRVLREVESLYGLKAHLMPLGVDTRAFRPLDPADARETLGLPQGVPIGLFVGRPDSSKGHDILLRVSQRMPEVLFLVAGGAGGKTGNVQSLGHVPHAEMPLWYSACDFFFLPSRYEGFGLSTIEALSCNLPVVVSQAAWPFPEEPTQCGAVISDGQDEDFIRAIRFVLASRDHFSPREFILPRHDMSVFEQSWRGLVDSLVSGGDS
jgi:glycosyltransferase involved in cell wall biosynthesis